MCGKIYIYDIYIYIYIYIIIIIRVKRGTGHLACGPNEINPSNTCLCARYRSSRLALCLSDHVGVHVTYGGLSREPLSIRPGSTIFSDVTFRGFWLSKWIERNIIGLGTLFDMRPAMLTEIYNAVSEGGLKLPETKLFHLSDFESAFKECGTGCKVAFDCRLDDAD